MDSWQTLGIAPTPDLRAIKRAYLARIKQARPEDDPEGFQAIRAAYEDALFYAPYVDPPAEDDAPPDSLQPVADAPQASTSPAAPDSDLPSWLINLADSGPPQDGPEATEATEFTAPPEQTQPADAGTPPDTNPIPSRLSAEASEAATGLLTKWLQGPSNGSPHLLAALWQAPQWQTPDGADMLEGALLDAVNRKPELSHHRIGQASLILHLAEHYQWFPQPARRGDLSPYAIGYARSVLLNGLCEAVWSLAEGKALEGARRTLQQQLESNLFIQLDMRQELGEQWGYLLLKHAEWPQGLGQIVFESFGWDVEAPELPPVVKERYQQLIECTLLQQIAQGEVTHDAIDTLAARALLADRLSYKQWEQAVKEDWHQRINKALVWLATYAPHAMEAIPPRTLRWWASPRPQESGGWFFIGLITWGTLTLLFTETAKPYIPNGWLWLLILPPVIYGSAMLGYNLSRGLGWLQVQWAIRIDWPWQAWDQALLTKIPVNVAWLYRHNLTPTRKLLPLALVYGSQFTGLGQHEGWAEPLSLAFIALFPTLFFWIVWSGLLRWLGNPKGALLWGKLRDVGFNRQGEFRA